MALMGLQCFFPLCKNNFWGQEEFMWPNEYSWLVQHLQLSTPWFQTCTNSGSSFNLECFFLRSFLLWKGPPLFVLPSVLWLNYEWNCSCQVVSCLVRGYYLMGSCFVHVQWTRLTLLVTEYLGCGLAGHHFAHGAPFMSTAKKKVEIFAHLYIVLNFHMFEFSLIPRPLNALGMRLMVS